MNIRKPFERVLKLPSDDKLANSNHKLHQNRGIWDIASQIQRAIRSSSEDKIIDKVNEVKLLEVISSQQYIEDKIKLE
ncbi:ALI_collapsed_G0025430.mRNA.1.CDS.1 [Saccharomyces cerevisiae]|nr:ALI_collapsed_G0025430.mRNA.1.CDS.1 [Saccharomyces cerevisiae]